MTAHLPAERRDQVEARLRGNLIAWLTAVRPNGQPESVPVWFLLEPDETMLVYGEPDKVKLRNIVGNPWVALGLDVTDLARDVIRLDATARRADEYPAADRVSGYAAKYAERIGALFGPTDRFAQLSTVPVLITPTKIRA